MGFDYTPTILGPAHEGQLVINMSQTELSTLTDQLLEGEESLLIAPSEHSWEENAATNNSLLNTHRIGTLLSLFIPMILIHYSNKNPEITLAYCIYNSTILTNLLLFPYSITSRNTAIAASFVALSSCLHMGLTIASWYFFVQKNLQIEALWPVHLVTFMGVSAAIGVGMDIKRIFSCNTNK